MKNENVVSLYVENLPLCFYKIKAFCIKDTLGTSVGKSELYFLENLNVT